MTQGEALSILKSGANVFLTGEPGSGKTHTINEYVSYLRDHNIEPSITASTGIAATHIGGMTIHSWSGIGIQKNLSPYDIDRIASIEYIGKRISRAKVLIIDEISMLPARMLNDIGKVCKAVRQSDEPFGGLQIILVGDFFQLPPVAKEGESMAFAYQSAAWEELNPLICYLSEQHRQDDDAFLSLLSAMRRNELEELHHEYIVSRRVEKESVPEGMTELYSHNKNVDEVNDKALKNLKGDFHTFRMESSGKDSLVEALKKGCLSPETLSLKIGAVVMCTKNNPAVGYVNGTLGTIVRFAESGYPVIKTGNDHFKNLRKGNGHGEEIEIQPAEWIVEDNGKIKARIIQIPLRLAWAITVHKSQGMSLDSALIDLSHAFAYGQGYVAISRVRRLSGLYLLGWNEDAFRVHPEIVEQDIEFKRKADEATAGFGKLSQAALEHMHHNFILASGGTLQKQKREPLKKKVVGETFLETLALWKEGKTIAEISAARALVPTTIFGHIETLVERGDIPKEDIEKILPKKIKKDLSKIHTTFRSLDTTSLTPVFEALKGVYSYEDLRLARMLLA